ncbi:MAG TPA: MTH1187 family thiamine-binding protein [Acidobacteriaceae bacterium]|nr:MTH1187 family thiamine-binding protein [Acidobacteriaceae bacterium]
MVLELTIIPLGSKHSISGGIAGVVAIIEKTGLDYQMTAFGTLVEGTWDELMELAKECHFEVRKNSDRVLTMMRIDDFGNRSGEIRGGIRRVEQRLGRAVKK